MDIDDAAEEAFVAMDSISDYDTTLHMYAKAAVKALGWREIAKEVPDFEDVVVCTDGTARWLDKRMEHFPDMKWNGHTPTHWHPLMNLPPRPHKEAAGGSND